MVNHKISVIVPVYNVESYISDCIDSLAYQTCNDFEIVFVDDCGNDNSISIIKKNLHRFSNASIYHRKQNGGLSAARNSGIQASNGDYLLFVDSDDYLTNNAISLFYESLSKGDFDVIVSAYTKIPENISYHNSVSDTIYGNDKIRNVYYNNKIVVPAWNKLVKKDFLVDNGLFFMEGIIHEDVLWSFMIMTKADSLFSIPEPTYMYRIRTNSIMTKSYGMRNINSLLAILNEQKNWITKEKKDIAKFYNKKLLEFTLTIYQRAIFHDFLFYYNIVRNNGYIIFYPTMSFLLNCLILKSCSCISMQIMTLLLKSKFKYLCPQK